jgi:hypothetical protein
MIMVSDSSSNEDYVEFLVCCSIFTLDFFFFDRSVIIGKSLIRGTRNKGLLLSVRSLLESPSAV